MHRLKQESQGRDKEARFSQGRRERPPGFPALEGKAAWAVESEYV